MSRADQDLVRWRVTLNRELTVVHFELLPDEPLSPDVLGSIGLPSDVVGREHLGLVISGRGPVWLYARLVHEAHPFAWVATYDPRLAGAVVVHRHRADAPAVGQVVDLSPGQR